VGIFLYRLDGVGFGTMENGRVQVELKKQGGVTVASMLTWMDVKDGV